MKKHNLLWGAVYTLSGIVFLILALTTGTKLGGILFGLAGAGIVPGLLTIGRYFYWRSPKHSQQYQEMMAAERIEQHDELKEKIRDKSGRYAYISGIFITAAAMLVFSILGSLEIIENAHIIVLYLGGYLVVQIVTGIIFFNQLLNKFA